jgi:DNA-binding beta-propeller fold protein YncE
MDLTVGVTTDKSGNVYEAAGSGYVSEYAQGIQEATAMCSPGGHVQGVAVDRRGDVFVTNFFLASSGSTIVEYEGGLELSHCNGTVLPMRFLDPAGIVIDQQGRLLVCDPERGVIDVIPHPYTSIAGTLGSGFLKPVTISVNKAGTQAYVADAELSRLFVLSYPGGSTIATLGRESGLITPAAAVSSQNYVP